MTHNPVYNRMRTLSHNLLGRLRDYERPGMRARVESVFGDFSALGAHLVSIKLVLSSFVSPNSETSVVVVFRQFRAASF